MAFQVTKKIPPLTKKFIKSSKGSDVSKSSTGPQYGNKGKVGYEYGSGQRRGASRRGPA